MNIVVLKGNLVSDPELKTLANDNHVANFRLALNRFYLKQGEKQKEVSYIDCEMWGRNAENFVKFMSKGRPALIKGRLRQDVWTDKETDKKRSKLIVVAEEFEFIDSANRQGSDGETSTSTKTSDNLNDIPI